MPTTRIVRPRARPTVAPGAAPGVTSARATRTEHDSLGDIEVDADVLWGAQTERSRRLFAIGTALMPIELIHAMAEIKRAGAEVNLELGLLDAVKADAIGIAAARVAAGEFDREFPLSVWQTGSGTQSHMNVNEVIARLATPALASAGGASRAGRADSGGTSHGRPLAQESGAQGSGAQDAGERGVGPGRVPAPRVHPNDDVNLGQSSNDVFPTAMHVAAVLAMRPLLQALTRLRAAVQAKSQTWADAIKIGRTHGQDATPVTLGQEFGGYDAQLALAEAALRAALPAVHALAIGATAVGTGLNTDPQFGALVAARLSERLLDQAQPAQPFVVASNLFAALAGHEALVGLHGALRQLAIALNKIANDIRLMGSGPRAGLGELSLPENEPGSSIMPGKVNPTQVEALTMVCAQVMGHDVAIGIAASQGLFELNVYKPLIALDVLGSIRLLGDAMASFSTHCVEGLVANQPRMAELMQGSLMLVTALTPHIGYQRAAEIARHAHLHGLSLREAAVEVSQVSATDFDAWVDPRAMLGQR